MATPALLDHRVSTAAGENAGLIARERQKSLMLRAWILARLVLHGVAGNAVGLFKPDGDQHTSWTWRSSCCLDSGSRTCAGIRLDWQLHSWNRILFAAIAWAIGCQDSADLLRSVDLGRCDAMDSKHLRLALALDVPDLCRI